MASPFLYADRVQDTTTTTGTGNLTLSGSAPTGFQTFNAAFGTNTYFYYTVATAGSSEWEVGEGHLSASTTLVRDTIQASSNAGAAVNFSAGTKNIFCTIAAYDQQHDSSPGRAYAFARGMQMP